MSQFYDANGNPVFTDVLAQNQPLGVLNAAVTTQLRGQSTVVVQVLTIGVQTLAFEGTVDGTNFFAVNMYPVVGGAAVTTTTANGQWIGIVAGMYQFRTRCSAYTSGSATVSQNAAQGTNEQAVSVGSAQNAVSAGQNAVVVEGAVTTAPPTYVTGNASALSLSVPGGLRVGEPQNTASAGLPAVLKMGAVTTAAPAYTTANASAISLTTLGGTRSDMSSVNAVALGSPAAFGTTPGAVTSLSANASLFIGTTAAVASSAGVMKVGIAGGAAGAAIDGAIAAVPPANALQIGIKAATANPANATAGNQVAIMADKAGRQVVTAGNVRELIGVQTTVITASVAETTIITAGGAGVFNDLSHISITTTDVVAAVITIKDATAGTTRLTFEYPPTAAAVGPLVCDFSIPISQATANANWTATVSVNAGAVAINCVFVKNL